MTEGFKSLIVLKYTHRKKSSLRKKKKKKCLLITGNRSTFEIAAERLALFDIFTPNVSAAAHRVNRWR